MHLTQTNFRCKDWWVHFIRSTVEKRCGHIIFLLKRYLFLLWISRTSKTSNTIISRHIPITSMARWLPSANLDVISSHLKRRLRGGSSSHTNVAHYNPTILFCSGCHRDLTMEPCAQLLVGGVPLPVDVADTLVVLPN